MERKSRKNFLDADEADDADLFSLLTDYQLSKIIIAQQHQRHLRLKKSSGGAFVAVLARTSARAGFLRVAARGSCGVVGQLFDAGGPASWWRRGEPVTTAEG